MTELTITTGIVSSESSITIPNVLMLSTIVIAMRIIIMLLIRVVGSRCEAAKLRSNAVYKIGRYSRASMSIRAMSKHASVNILAPVTISIFPNKKLIKFGAYPGVRKTNIMPIDMPSDHSTPVAASSLTRPFLLKNSMPNADPMAKTIAPKIGSAPM